jgi:glycosyltransferase involved in cell wall biosynthesis
MTNWRANLVTKVIGTLINHVCRVIDYQVAQRVTVFLANSQETARRIAKFYRRKSIVVHPPVELGVAGARAVRARTQRAYLLYVNRLAYAKHPELAIAAANALKLPLKVVGSGPMFEGLRRKAGPTVELLGSVSDQHLAKLYAGAECLLYPVEDEDFGIVPVEAMQFGTPVIAHASGGPLETIQENKTGLFFHKLTTAQLSAAIREARRIRWNHAAIARHGAQFSREVFVENMHLVVGATLKSNQP